MIRTFCPGCGQDYEIGDELRGKRVECELCGAKWDVPVNVTPTVPLKVSGTENTAVGKKILLSFVAVIIAVVAQQFFVRSAGEILRGPLDDANYNAKLCLKNLESYLDVWEKRAMTEYASRKLDSLQKQMNDSQMAAIGAKRVFEWRMTVCAVSGIAGFAIIAIAAIVWIWKSDYPPWRLRHDVKASIVFGAFGTIGLLGFLCNRIAGGMVTLPVGLIALGVVIWGMISK